MEVAALPAGQVRLVAEDGEVAALLSLLFADAGFEVLDAPAASRVPPLGLPESLPEAVRERAFVWERHVREVGTSAQRKEAKAAELSAVGMPRATVVPAAMRDLLEWTADRMARNAVLWAASPPVVRRKDRRAAFRSGPSDKYGTRAGPFPVRSASGTGSGLPGSWTVAGSRRNGEGGGGPAITVHRIGIGRSRIARHSVDMLFPLYSISHGRRRTGATTAQGRRMTDP
ncbi:hypothetical protein ACF05L_22280 [Streptomyces bobili]|uniref:hypothetical protein n=1 Tax=Streptomyces bobili TaxID=67280 RepID=UPI0036FD6A44